MVGERKEARATDTAPRWVEGGRGPVYVYNHWCKGCGICAAFCPRDVLEMGQDDHPVVANPERCTYCRLCEALCPDFAMTVMPKEKGRKE